MKKIILLIAVLFSLEVLACSCAPATFESQLAQADSIYIGILTKGHSIKSTKDNHHSHVKAKFKVLESLKGKRKRNVYVTSNDAHAGGCGIPLELGEVYLIMKQKGTDYISWCGGSERIGYEDAYHKAKAIREALAKASNKALNKDATNVAPIS